MKNNYAVIMAGGIGSRFWPISRSLYPKQFIDIFGTGETLIQSTYNRFKSIVPEENIFIVTNQNHVELVREQLPNLDKNQILSEPVMRNTAPCIAYACHKINQLNPNSNIVVTPSDHLIISTDDFRKCIDKGLETARKHDCLLTLGVLPSRPDTGYGYIQYVSKSLDSDFKKVKTFTEKPNEELAKTFIQSGDFLWNSGIFIWSAKSILKSLRKYLPELTETLIEGNDVYNTEKEQDFIASAYTRCPNISIDFAVMEKAENVYVLPVKFGWSDLGTWGSIYELSQKDSTGNFVKTEGDVLLYDSNNCLVNISSSDKLIVLQGLDNFIVIESENALLIFPREKEQHLTHILADIKKRFGNQYT